MHRDYFYRQFLKLSQEPSRTWEYYGRYGDDDRAITINISKLPEELSPVNQKALIELYLNEDASYGGDFEYKYHLVRQVGNAWNHSLLFAPQVHAWMEARKIKRG